MFAYNFRKILTICLFQMIFYQGFGQHINPGVALTFDDYSVANWHKLLPIFEKYNAKATFYICYPNRLDAEKQQMIRDLHAASNEIACHGYNHLNSVNFIDTSSIENFINQEILPAISWFDTVLNIPVQSFSYPYGARNLMLDSALLQYFRVLRGTVYSFDTKLSKVTSLSNGGLIYGVGIDDGYGFSLNQIKEQLDVCKRDSLIQVFYSHTPVDKVTTDYQITYANLDSILSYISHLGLPFYTSNEVWLPIPKTSSGDTVVLTDEIPTSTYYFDLLEYGAEWKLLPQDAGKLIINENEAMVEWNNGFNGEAALQVAASNRCGIGNFSGPLKIKVNTSVGISRMNYENLSIYPNPSLGNFTIVFPIGNFEKQIAIYNLAGELVFESITKLDKLHVKMSGKGLFIAKIILDNKIYVSKITIE
jgi:peptidoglycan/xylan/chitin deacetylase (PgdA/CDA1 family)